MTRALSIIADDFTGACDVGAQFVKCAIPGTAFIGMLSKDLVKHLIIQDTETRNLDTTTAYQRVRKYCEKLDMDRTELVYKKIDSTLRGNTGSELDAVLDTFENRSIIVAPTYPEQQRIVIQGKLFVKGTPLQKTEFSIGQPRDSRTSDIKTIITTQTRRAIAQIPILTVRDGAKAVASTIRRLIAQGVRIVCADAVNRADLNRIAEACILTGALPCGSAGLAGEIATRLRSRSVKSKVLMICATTSGETVRAVKNSIKDPRCALVTARTTYLTGNRTTRQQELNRLRTIIQRAFRSVPWIIVYTRSPRRAYRRAEPLSQRDIGNRIVSGLANAICPLIASENVDAIILTGGEMSYSFFRESKARSLRLQNELLPGVALSEVVGGPNNGLSIVTKAGGFSTGKLITPLMKILSSRKYGQRSLIVTVRTR